MEDKDIPELAQEISDEMRKYETQAYMTGSHNFKIDMKLLFGAMANIFKSDKQMAIFYKILKDIDKSNLVTVNHIMIKNTLGMTNKTFYGLINRMIDNYLILKIDVVGQRRGYQKYMVNPTMIFNYRKMKSRELYEEAMNLWNIYKSKRINNGI